MSFIQSVHLLPQLQRKVVLPHLQLKHVGLRNIGNVFKDGEILSYMEDLRVISKLYLHLMSIFFTNEQLIINYNDLFIYALTRLHL